MAWARLDDKFHSHRKAIAAGLEAIGLFTMALSWAHSERLTSPHPGVVPVHMVGHLAGGAARGKRLAQRLNDTGLFDDLTEYGWPIHDFADYLPKYDPEQKREAGRRGGSTRAANRKQSAKQSASGPEADRKQTSSSRASARTSPNPNLFPEAKASGADDCPSGPQVIIGEWLERCRSRPPKAVVGQASKTVAALLAEGIDPDDVRRGMATWHAKGAHPASLPAFVNEAMNAAPPTRPGATTTPTPTAPRLADLCDEHGRDQATCPFCKREREQP